MKDLTGMVVDDLTVIEFSHKEKNINNINIIGNASVNVEKKL